MFSTLIYGQNSGPTYCYSVCAVKRLWNTFFACFAASSVYLKYANVCRRIFSKIDNTDYLSSARIPLVVRTRFINRHFMSIYWPGRFVLSRAVISWFRYRIFRKSLSWAVQRQLIRRRITTISTRYVRFVKFAFSIALSILGYFLVQIW